MACWEKQEEVIKVILRSGKFNIEDLDVDIDSSKEGQKSFKMPFCTAEEESGQLVIKMDDLPVPENVEIEVIKEE